MRFEEINYQLLARYLAGECSDGEAQQIRNWLEENPQNTENFKEFQHIWNLSASDQGSPKNFYDAEKEWSKLKARFAKEVKEDRVARRERNVRKSTSAFGPPSIHSIGQKVARIAAIFLVAGCMGLFFYKTLYQPEPAPQNSALREVSTTKGQRANLTLGDGTNVLLNAASTVEFPHQFEADVREVFLDGEAYFNVKRNPVRPFIIHSQGLVIRVLGTSFSVRSYPEDEQVRVVVKEGRVSFETEDRGPPQQAMITANQVGRYHFKNHKIEVSRVEDMELYLSWREGYLKFREELMSNVAIELERRYGVEVSFEDPAIREKLLTAFLKSRSLSNVLDVIAMSLNVEYLIHGNKVILSLPEN